MIIHSQRIVTSTEVVSGYLVIEEGKIVRIAKEEENLKADLDFGYNRVLPGIIDTHNHGNRGYRMQENMNADTLKHYLKGCAAGGVTTVFPTFFKLNDYKAYHYITEVIDQFQDGAQIGGIHSEGPFGARVGEKGINNGYPKVDMEMCKDMVKEGKGHLKLVAIAPEIEGAIEAIQYFTSEGITVAAYHTNANYEQANKGIDAGITVMTHLGNVMTGLHHRDVGTLGAGLLRDEAYCELICDGLHISLPMIQIMLKVKDHDKIMMISDNVQYAGIPVGAYRSASADSSDASVVNVTEEGFVLTSTGRLAGSSQPVIYGISNLVEKLHMDIVEVCRMSSLNPARKYNLTGKGALEPGYDADFCVIDDNYKVLETYCLAKKVFGVNTDTDLVNKEFLDNYKIA